MYSKVNAEDIEPAGLEATDADVLPVGYRLKTENSRSNLWVLDEGDEIFRHRQGEQEEVYYVVEGSVEFEVGEEGEVDEFVVDADGFVAVEPEAPRKLVAREPSRVFIVGAPFVKDDGEILEDV
ncbi:MAG: cupin domain-containing protein [Halobacteria archaeon]